MQFLIIPLLLNFNLMLKPLLKHFKTIKSILLHQLSQEMTKKWILICLFVFVASKGLFAIGNDTAIYPKLDISYLKSYYYDTKEFVVSPAKWKKKQWIEFGTVTAAGILAYTQDEKIQKYFVNHQSETASNLSKYIFEPFGNGKGTCVVIGNLYATGWLLKDKRLAGTSLTAAKAFGISSVGALIIKQLTHRHRPYQDDVPDHANWDGPFSSIEYTSFPSGHSTAAFSLATVFAMEYSSTIWVPVLAFTLATGTAVSRLYDNKHWASDVVIGSALGFVTGRFMWKQSKKNGKKKFAVIPNVGLDHANVAIIIRVGEP
jgi:membrane-associated phospholipid phosphatase